MVNAINAPATIPGVICGTTTFVSACHGVAPKSIAASARFGSSDLIFGITDNITYGIQNAICARSMVTYPFSTWNVMNNNMNPIAVTISGFMIGRLFACSIRSRISFFDLLTPIAAIVPATVEINVASSAILNVVDSASIISADSSICLYQRSENPVKLVSDFPSLNENIIMYRIGR